MRLLPMDATGRIADEHRVGGGWFFDFSWPTPTVPALPDQ